MTKPMWTLETALAFIREHQPKVAPLGYYLALGGGVLNTGSSVNDLDIVAVPRTSAGPCASIRIVQDYFMQVFGKCEAYGEVPSGMHCRYPYTHDRIVEIVYIR